MNTTTDIHVHWWREGTQMIYISDPFVNLEAARAYCDFRRREHDAVCEIWEVQKTARKLE